jgi:PadR family transcriptional regulator, regulatory protein AphA
MSQPASHSLLGILSLGAMSGYDIQKFVQAHLGYFWKESYGQIYPMLKRMAAQDLVEVRVERQRGKPDRRVYSLTRAGRAELERWLAKAPKLPSPRNELLLKLFFARLGNGSDILRHVEEFGHRHQALLRQYDEAEKWLYREQAQHPGLPYWLMTLDFGRRHSQALLGWSEATTRELRRLEKQPHSRPRKKKRGSP